MHATHELMEAMRGVAPIIGSYYPARLAACAPTATGPRVFSFLYEGLSDDHFIEDLDVVDCPACLRLMRDAVDPVRWDHLEERGLAPKLEAA